MQAENIQYNSYNDIITYLMKLEEISNLCDWGERRNALSCNLIKYVITYGVIIVVLNIFFRSLGILGMELEFL